MLRIPAWLRHIDHLLTAVTTAIAGRRNPCAGGEKPRPRGRAEIRRNRDRRTRVRDTRRRQMRVFNARGHYLLRTTGETLTGVGGHSPCRGRAAEAMKT